jgi:hypothetical protein
VKGSEFGKNDKITEFVRDADVLMQVSDRALTRILNSGELKNRFEKGAVDGVGKGNKNYNSARTEAENRLFGFDDKTDPGYRPKYGYLEHPDRAKSQGASMKQYGEVQIVFNDSVKSRSTYTIGDSLDDGARIGSNAYSVTDPSAPKLTYHNPAYTVPTKEVIVGKTTDEWKAVYKDGHKAPIGYIETQIFDKVTLSDIREIRVPRSMPISPTLQKKLDKAGLKVTKLPDPHRRFYSIIPEPAKAFLPEEKD